MEGKTRTLPAELESLRDADEEDETEDEEAEEQLDVEPERRMQGQSE